MKSVLSIQELSMILEKTEGVDILSKLEKFKNENYGSHFVAATSPVVWEKLAGDSKSPAWMRIRDISTDELLHFYDPATISPYCKAAK